MVSVPVPVEHDECGEKGSDDPMTGLPQCILMRQVTSTNAQAIADKVFDSKQNPYEAFGNPVTMNPLSYILLFFIVVSIYAAIMARLPSPRKHMVVGIAVLLILLLALLQKRDGRDTRTP